MDAGRLMRAPLGKWRSLVLWLAALPPVLVTAGVLIFSVSELTGHTPFSIGAPANVAEAAGFGSGAELLRLLRAGHDPHAELPIRPEVISSSITQASALEAAVWSRRGQIIALLDREGALTVPAERQHVLCLARDLQVDEIVEYLDKDGTASVSCEEGRALAGVQARSRE